MNDNNIKENNIEDNNTYIDLDKDTEIKMKRLQKSLGIESDQEFFNLIIDAMFQLKCEELGIDPDETLRRGMAAKNKLNMAHP